jgi:Tfp pilus assembly protein PilV
MADTVRSHRSRLDRGTTLVEAMVAMAVLLIGTAGVMSLNSTGLRMAGDARRITRATAIAQDLVDQIALWPYADPRLANGNPSNDGAIGDPAFALEGSGTPAVDHGESDLTLGGTSWVGTPTGDIAGYERYWNVAYLDDDNGNGVWDAARIAVIVRWPMGSGFRRIVLLTTKFNPADSL